MREVARFDMNTTLMNVRVINMVVYMDGRLRRNHGPGAVRDLRKALSDIEDVCRTMPGITDVVIDVAID